MSYYFIARIQILNKQEYQKYLDKAESVFNKFNGKYLSVDNNTKVLEGHWDCTRTVLIEFASKKDFEKWYYSPEYQEILKFRLESADCNSALIKGL
ncbi:MAG: DUF1330 domain-containing protein [Bacteroidales bacterium]|nr:DUF1330 domain-containing protein [Bacteroidales bacterium]